MEERIRSWPQLTCLKSTVHGDLHRANVFVTGGTNTCIIDFANVSYAPTVADLACLEVSLVFGAPGGQDKPGVRLPDQGSPAGITWLRHAYRYPLDPSKVPSLLRDRKRTDIVRAIRGEARKIESDPLPYAVAVMAYLVRVASFDDNPLEDRALAYELAVILSDDIDAEFDRRKP